MKIKGEQRKLKSYEGSNSSVDRNRRKRGCSMQIVVVKAHTVKIEVIVMRQ